MALPTVAIIGRMNVGKSTLFNRLTSSNRAIVSSWPGTTRDVKSAVATWRGTQFQLIDTGGLDVEEDEQLEERVVTAAFSAVERADVAIFVIDGQVGLMPQDKLFAKYLKRLKKPTVLAINKIDSERKERSVPPEVYRLSFDHTVMISGSNGRSTGDLLDMVYEALPAHAQPEMDVERTTVAIVGRPNVGKSSLLNAILGEERVIVADAAHTTRDTNDIPYEYKGTPFMLIDTAGIRKQSNVGKRWGDKRLGEIEKESVEASIRSIKRADVVLFVIEANQGLTDQDKKIASLAYENGKGLLVLVNKWDLIPDKTSSTINEFTKYFQGELPLLRYAPIMYISATEGKRVRETLDMVLRVTANFNREIALEDLEPILFKVKAGYKPKWTNVRKDRKPIVVFNRLKQVGTKPARFYFKVSKPKDVPRAIPRIIERELRARFDFYGVKIGIEIGQ